MQRFLIVCFLGLLLGCKPSSNNEQPRPGPTPLSIDLPAHFDPMPIPVGNPLTVEGVEMGRRLFNEPMLSVNSRVTCATCHTQNIAFSDGFALSSLGVTGTRLPRHTPTMQNLAWHTGYFWDGGVRSLESIPPAPIQDHDEMGDNLIDVIRELNRAGTYKEMVKKAFGDDTITQPTLLKAMAQYMRTLVSCNSKYDLYRQGKATFSNAELEGLQIVQAKCTPCHQEPYFTDHKYHNNGLQAVYNDPFKEGIRMGRYRITYVETDKGRFKTPTLRNVMVSSPYMHDGRIQNINAVLDHYSDHVVDSPYLDSLLKPNIGIRLTPTEKTSIVAFLNTLTDSKFLNP